MPRYFTLEQAQQLLPQVGSAVEQAIHLKSEFEHAEAELQSANQRIMMMGGSLVNRDHLIEQKNLRGSSATKLKEAVDEIQSYGCLLKDLDIGLIDFPTLYHGEEVYLCWKLGEDGIGFWHGVDEGFRGRKTITREFLDHHQGDRTH
jgi:hypothetical protein